MAIINIEVTDEEIFRYQKEKTLPEYIKEKIQQAISKEIRLKIDEGVKSYFDLFEEDLKRFSTRDFASIAEGVLSRRDEICKSINQALIDRIAKFKDNEIKAIIVKALLEKRG